MTKYFCDICGKEAKEDITRETVLISHGKPWRSQIPEGEHQCKIEVEGMVTYINHQAGLEGPPDLCCSCYIELLQALINKLKEIKK